jgi:hypothetical protein
MFDWDGDGQLWASALPKKPGGILDRANCRDQPVGSAMFWLFLIRSTSLLSGPVR